MAKTDLTRINKPLKKKLQEEKERLMRQQGQNISYSDILDNFQRELEQLRGQVTNTMKKKRKGLL